jgi:hypothetical protein
LNTLLIDLGYLKPTMIRAAMSDPGQTPRLPDVIGTGHLNFVRVSKIRNGAR